MSRFLLFAWMTTCGACVPTVYSEQLQLQLQATDVTTLGLWNFPAGMLAGTTTCPTLGWLSELGAPLGMAPLDCYQLDLYGPVEQAGGCFTFLEPGSARLEFEPLAACAVAPDQFQFPVLDPSEAVARPRDLDAAARDLLLATERGLPPSQPEGEPYRVVAGGSLSLFPWLHERDDGASVGVEIARVSLEAEAEAGLDWAAATDHLAVAPEVGATGTLEAVYHHPVYGATFPFAEIIGVDPSEATGMEIIPMYADYGLFQVPYVARAVVRDAQGRLLWGAPVLWTLDEGHLAMGALGQARPGPDYVLLADDCEAPPLVPVVRKATLRATFGPFTDTVELEWTAPPGNALGWTPNPECVGPSEPPPLTEPEPEPPIEAPEAPEAPAGSPWLEARWSSAACRCSGRPGPPPALPGLALALWALQARRRSNRSSRPR